MAYQRKTTDEYQIHQLTSYGWEEVNCETTWKDARRSLKEYRAEGYTVKLVKRRVRL